MTVVDCLISSICGEDAPRQPRNRGPSAEETGLRATDRYRCLLLCRRGKIKELVSV